MPLTADGDVDPEQDHPKANRRRQRWLLSVGIAHPAPPGHRYPPPAMNKFRSRRCATPFSSDRPLPIRERLDRANALFGCTHSLQSCYALVHDLGHHQRDRRANPPQRPTLFSSFIAGCHALSLPGDGRSTAALGPEVTAVILIASPEAPTTPGSRGTFSACPCPTMVGGPLGQEDAMQRRRCRSAPASASRCHHHDPRLVVVPDGSRSPTGARAPVE